MKEEMFGITLNFIKGHMGGNEIILLIGEQIPKGRELEVGLLALNAPNIRGHQAGLLYNSHSDGYVKVKIVDHASGGFISACGGLTQVFGKALIETDLAEELGIEITEPVTDATLETDVGPVQIKIQITNGSSREVLTNMKSFVDECYESGVQSIIIDNLVKAVKVGKCLVININDLRAVFSERNFSKINRETSEILATLQRQFDSEGYLHSRNGDFSLYDLSPSRPGNDGRAIFPHRISGDSIEPACGTGTVAIGIAMVERGEIEQSDTALQLSFESGGDIYGIGGPNSTSLGLQIRKGKVVDASFSHSLVEILATGTLRLHL